jgi:hypothetical protein
MFIVTALRTSSRISRYFNGLLCSINFILVNVFHTFSLSCPGSPPVDVTSNVFQTEPSSAEIPYSAFRVTQGKKYRFRIIGATCTSCAYKFTVGQHTLLVIAVDGNPVEPVRVNSIDIYPGNTWLLMINTSRRTNETLRHSLNIYILLST